MAIKLIKKGEVICIASEVYESYYRAGPYLVEKDFDLSEFITTVKSSQAEHWEITTLMREIPCLLLAQDFVSTIACRNVHLGAFGEWHIKEEKDDYI
jgi:hypothetical protein